MTEPNQAVKEPVKKKKAISSKQKIGLGVILGLMVIGGFIFGYESYRFESTDDAYVQANSTQLAPKVSAIVTHVLVQENQKVRAGQIIAQLERKDYQNTLQDAIASLGSLQANLHDAEADYHRNQMLLKDHAVTQQQFDHAEANYFALVKQANAAQAKVDQARLDLDYTSVRAPVDGQIARRSVDVGMYVAAGTAIFGFIPFDERWVDANFKETQLNSIEVGKRAEVSVDAIPGKTFEGVVESVSPATGSTFTLLPPDNATGNFTKVVQRVPVRILLKNLSTRDFELLQAGLSANVDVLKHSEPEPVPSFVPIFSVNQLPKNDQAGQSGE